MNPTSGPSGQTSSLKAQAQKAIAALKNGNHEDAIALIEPLLDQTNHPTTQAHLRRNLAKAYMGLNDAPAAFQQCEHLQRNPDPEVQKWAKKAIAHLRKQYPNIDQPAPSPSPTSTGFTPLESSSPAPTTSVKSPQSSTGFNAFTPAAAPSSQDGDWISLSQKAEIKAEIKADGRGVEEQGASQTPLDSPNHHQESWNLTPQHPNDPTPQPPIQNPKSKIQNPKSPVFSWKNVDRAKNWSAIRTKPSLTSHINTILIHGWTAIALWFVAKGFLQIGMALGNPMRNQVQRFMRFDRWYFLERYPGRVAAVVLLVLLILAPWILDLLLRWHHQAKPFSLGDRDRNGNAANPHAQKLLQQSSRKHKHPVPTLKLIPTQTPVLFSYGLRPRVSRIVVSQGLLQQVNDDELATLLGAELSHIRGWNLALMTLVTVSAHISYGLYQLFSDWADGRGNAFLQWVGAMFAAIAYGMFWLVRGTGLWLSRSRFEHSDRAAVNFTGHPNAMTRALMKLAIATVTDIRRRGYTDPVLEKFEWLTPVGYRSALSAGSVFPFQYQSESSDQSPTLFDWEYRNPHRGWLSINNTHPPLGDRLYRLAQIAKKWKLESELALPSGARVASSPKMKSQVAPFIGFFVGAALTLVLWFVGVLAEQFSWQAIAWLQYDSQSIFRGLLALSFCFGTIMRFNDFFPEIKSSNTRQEELTELLTQPERVPADSQRVQLEGKLLGRRGVGNWLNQDLVLQTQTGLVRLHCISMLGAVGNLIFGTIRLQSLKGRNVKVTGWLRRGAIPWIDVETIKSQRGKTIQAGHPMWSMLLATAAALWGAYVLYF